MPHKCPVILVQTNVKTTSSIFQAPETIQGSIKNIYLKRTRHSIFFKKAVVKCQNKWIAMIVWGVCNSVTFITYNQPAEIFHILLKFSNLVLLEGFLSHIT